MHANRPSTDHDLISRCQAHDPAAWEQLDFRLRERGQHLLPKALGAAAGDRALTEELIQDTFTEMFFNQKLLDAFYESGHSLEKYLDYLLNRTVKRHYQKRQRRLGCEKHLSQFKLAELAPVRWLPSIEQELIERLTPAERRYLEWAKQTEQDAPPCPFRPSYARELERRIVRKARRLLYGE